MKSLKIYAPIAVKLFSLTLFLVALIGFQDAKAQLYFANFEGSSVKISGTKGNGPITRATSSFVCEGNFSTLNGELQNLNSLNFTLPLNKKNQPLINPVELGAPSSQSNINFKLTHSMVLPEMGKIHAIGYLDIQGVKTRVAMHLDYIENNAETITVMGKKAIKLSDYKKDPISVFADAKTQDIIQLDIKLVIKNPVKTDYIAALVK